MESRRAGQPGLHLAYLQHLTPESVGSESLEVLKSGPGTCELASQPPRKSRIVIVRSVVDVNKSLPIGSKAISNQVERKAVGLREREPYYVDFLRLT